MRQAPWEGGTLIIIVIYYLFNIIFGLLGEP